MSSDDILAFLESSGMLYTLITAVGTSALIWYRKKLAAVVSTFRGISDGLQAIPQMQREISQLSEQVEMVMCTIRVESDNTDVVGRFDAGASGGHTYVNQTIARWLGVGKSELLGWNYLNFIHEDDVDRYHRLWEECRRTHRKFAITVRMVSAKGDVIPLEVTAVPVPDTPPVKKWIGTLRRVDDTI